MTPRGTPTVATLDPGPDKIIGPGHDFGIGHRQNLRRRLPAVPEDAARRCSSAFACAFLLVNVLLVAVTWLFFRGVGIWGIMIPVAWGFAIVNFVWWIGIGHAGTLISAILLLLKQDWRTSINRFSEAMTLFAVACAGMFPILHLGRPWLAYWLLPYPNTMWLWPQPRSPLIWDVFAVSTYGTVSLLFWFIGLVPDLATMRDKAAQYLGAENLWHAGAGLARIRQALGALSEGLSAAGRALHAAGGFRSLGRELRLRRQHCARLAHHHFPALLRRGRDLFRLRDGDDAGHPRPPLVSPGRPHHHAPHGVHGESDAGHRPDRRLRIRDGSLHGLVQRQRLRTLCFVNRAWAGGYWWTYWLLILCNILIPQLLWSRRVRMNIPAVFVISLIVNVGMWLERFVIVVTSLTRDFVPSSWGMYYPTIWDWSTYLGTIGVFLSLMFLFIRGLPAISIFEMREVVHEEAEHAPRA